MDITSHNDEIFPFGQMVYVKRNGRWVNETSGNQLIIKIECPAFAVMGKGPTTLTLKANHKEEGLLKECTRLRVIFDGETSGVTSITKQLPDGSIEELDRFAISIMNHHHTFFWEKPTEVV